MSVNPHHPGHADHDPALDENWRPKGAGGPPAGLSGGEVDEEAKALRDEVSRRIGAEPDVREVIHLAHRCDGTFLYLISTPWLDSFPRYVIGTCDRALENVRPLFRCGERWSADAEWHRLRHVEGRTRHV